MINKLAKKVKVLIHNVKPPFLKRLLTNLCKFGNVCIRSFQDFLAIFKNVKLYKKESLSDENQQWLIRLGKKVENNPYEGLESYQDPKGVSLENMRGDDLYLLSLLPDGCSVLELGCGNGRLGLILTKLKGISYTGVDISDVAIEAAKKNGINAYVVDLNNLEDPVLNIIMKKKYDYVISVWTLQLLQKQEEIIPKLFQCTDIQLHSMWNAGHWSSRLRMLFGRFPIYSFTSGAKGDHIYPFAYGAYNRHWTFKDFNSYAKELGFRAIPVGVGYKFTMKTASLKRTMFYPSLRAGRVLWRIDRM